MADNQNRGNQGSVNQNDQGRDKDQGRRDIDQGENRKNDSQDSDTDIQKDR